LASKYNFLSSKFDLNKINKNLLKITIIRILHLEIKKNYFFWKSQICNLHWIFEGISNYWLQILLQNISLYTSWSNHMNLISGSYFTTIDWDSLLNYNSKLHFIIHFYNFKNLNYPLIFKELKFVVLLNCWKNNFDI